MTSLTLAPKPRFDYSALPWSIRDEMRRYAEDHLAPSEFLRAVLERRHNDAVMLADAVSMLNLERVIQWVETIAPPRSWGSREKVAEWVKREKR